MGVQRKAVKKALNVPELPEGGRVVISDFVVRTTQNYHFFTSPLIEITVNFIKHGHKGGGKGQNWYIS